MVRYLWVLLIFLPPESFRVHQGKVFTGLGQYQQPESGCQFIAVGRDTHAGYCPDKPFTGVFMKKRFEMDEVCISLQ